MCNTQLKDQEQARLINVLMFPTRTTMMWRCFVNQAASSLNEWDAFTMVTSHLLSFKATKSSSMTALHDMNTSLCQRAVFSWSPSVELSLSCKRGVSIRGNQEIIDIRNSLTMDSSVRRSLDPETWFCCQGSPSLTCRLRLDSFH